MPNILAKRVSMIELFYDLVFAYMISQATSLIHHLHHGIISPISFLVFAVIVIVFINSWMFQSVFTNRYGSSS
ncbi:MAG: low temperature requirement protein A [Lactobacillus sp.]|uniref:low temperature requirement protein A n=1 Tax=Lactobacillus sp. TaxID=1591 RepID=UPI0023CB867F|nr:low temperature requirement protein A [Lactobacillus sp.]MDE7049492.1 low temperature requirement protein A [Lactobacillus sp.]